MPPNEAPESPPGEPPESPPEPPPPPESSTIVPPPDEASTALARHCPRRLSAQRAGAAGFRRRSRQRSRGRERGGKAAVVGRHGIARPGRITIRRVGNPSYPASVRGRREDKCPAGGDHVGWTAGGRGRLARTGAVHRQDACAIGTDRNVCPTPVARAGEGEAPEGGQEVQDVIGSRLGLLPERVGIVQGGRVADSSYSVLGLQGRVDGGRRGGGNLADREGCLSCGRGQARCLSYWRSGDVVVNHGGESRSLRVRR